MENSLKTCHTVASETNVYACVQARSLASLLANVALLIYHVVMCGRLFGYLIFALLAFCLLLVLVAVSAQFSCESL